jgi:hypothetical protein
VKDWGLQATAYKAEIDFLKMVDQKSAPMVPQYMQQNKRKLKMFLVKLFCRY